MVPVILSKAKYLCSAWLWNPLTLAPTGVDIRFTSVFDFSPFGCRPQVRYAHRKLRLSESKESLLALPNGSSFVKQNLFNYYLFEDKRTEEQKTYLLLDECVASSLATMKSLNLQQWENEFSPCSMFKLFKLGNFPTQHLIAVRFNIQLAYAACHWIALMYLCTCVHIIKNKGTSKISLKIVSSRHG